MRERKKTSGIFTSTLILATPEVLDSEGQRFDLGYPLESNTVAATLTRYKESPERVFCRLTGAMADTRAAVSVR